MKNKLVSVFRDATTDQMLTIVAQHGKSAFNVKASVKTGKGKGSPKAVPGCRHSVQTQEEAQEIYSSLVDQAEKAGWTRVPRTSRNAFQEIPKPGVVTTAQVGAPAPAAEPAAGAKGKKTKAA